METVLGLFERLEHANQALSALKAVGFARECVNILSHEEATGESLALAIHGPETPALEETIVNTGHLVLGALASLVISDATARRYAEGIKQGGALVIARSPGGLASKAQAIMTRYCAVDVHFIDEKWLGEQRESQALPAQEDFYYPLLWKQLHDIHEVEINSV